MKTHKLKKNDGDIALSNLIMLYFIILPLSYVLKFNFGTIALFTYPIIYLLIIFKYKKFLVHKKHFLYIFLFFVIASMYSLIGYYYYIYNWFGLMYLFFITTLPWFLVSININEFNTIIMCFKKKSTLIFLSNIILLIYCIKSGRNMYGNMEISYSILPLGVFSFYVFMNDKNFKSLIYFLVSLVIIVAVGSRGPLVCILLYILAFMILNAKKHKILTLAFFGLILFITLNFQSIILQTIKIFEGYNIPSRTLYKIIEEDFADGTGRTNIYEVTFDLLNNHPVLGVGLGVERITINYVFNNMEKDMSSCYPHNIILEILVQFGYFIGLTIIFFIIFVIYKAFSKSNLLEKNVLIIFGIMEGVRLMISSSYLLSPVIFMFFGFCLKKAFIEEEIKK